MKNATSPTIAELQKSIANLKITANLDHHIEYTTFDAPALDDHTSLPEILAAIIEVLKERAPHQVRRKHIDQAKQFMRDAAREQNESIEVIAMNVFYRFAEDISEMEQALEKEDKAAN
jgi:hypothetical protein